MTANVGGIDRILRIVIGLVLVAGFFLMPQTGWRWVLLLGLVPLVTGMVRFCPLYPLLGISTCPMRK